MAGQTGTTTLPPFSQDRELYTKFRIDPTSLKLTRLSSTGKTGKPAALPGQPHILLDGDLLRTHLTKELRTEYLDDFSPHLWLVAKQSYSHISSLTHQIVRGRNIVITEEAKLHLLWYHDRVFIKPLPAYLLSHAFWTYYLLSPTSPIPQPERDQILFAARGYLRSWSYLIQHKSDFVLATTDTRLPLLPKKLAFGSFMRLMASCRDNIANDEVSPRYHFGELRLSRINLWSQVLLKRFSYHKASGQYSAYFSRYFGIILFLFAFFSTALSAMQVALAAAATVNVPSGGQFSDSWNLVLLVSGWFSIAVLIFIASIIVFLGSKFVYMIGRESVFAGKDLWRKRRR